MRRLTYSAIVVSILLLASWLRFADLASPPVHFDEATGARIMGHMLEGQPYRYDPTHFHGPMLAYWGAVTAKIQGERSWQSLTAAGIRRTTAVAGVLLVLVLLFSKPLVGTVPSLAAATLIAASPVLTHFNRIFIHESVFVLMLCAAGLLAAYWWRKPSFWLAALTGIFIGLAGTTRETFVLAPALWVAALFILRLRPPISGRPLLLSIAIGCFFTLLTLVLVFSNFLTRPMGFFDFVSTYWQYETTPGHDKPGWYYISLYLFPFSHGRIHWWLGGAFLLAICSLVLPASSAAVRAGRLLFVSGILQAAVFSFIPYKVPWLMLMPWTQIVIAAGFTIGAACSRLRGPALLIPLLGLAVLSLDLVQAFRVPAPERTRNSNPLRYVETVPQIDLWTQRKIGWLEDAGVADQVVAVVGPGQWPLPWYLRPLPKVGYWETPPDDMDEMPLVIAMPSTGESIAEKLADTHTLLYEGLRTDTPVFVLLRNDVWHVATSDPSP